MSSQLVKYRMDLHQIPELGFEEFKTKAYIYEQIKELNCIIHEVGETGLILYFNKQQNQTVAFRADMDALPLHEMTGLDFASTHSGLMHACGHDGHMAILLGLAHYIDQKETLSKNVVLIFQPSEEKEAGAHTIVASGLLEHYQVEAIYGLHLWPGLTKGQVYSRAKELMAQASEVTVVVHGKSAHVASSAKGIDALQIACRYLTDIYNMEATLPEATYRLLKFGQFNSGTVRNILSEKTKIEGTLRSYSCEIHNHLKSELQIIADQYEKEYGCKISIDYNDGYDAVINDALLFSEAKDKISYLQELEKPVLQAEDFGVYGQHHPTLFCFLGIGDTPPLHNSRFDFDMSVLDKGLQLFIDLLQI